MLDWRRRNSEVVRAQRVRQAMGCVHLFLHITCFVFRFWGPAQGEGVFKEARVCPIMLSLKITDLNKASWWFVIPIYVEPGLRVVHIELKTRLGALLPIVYLTGGLAISRMFDKGAFTPGLRQRARERRCLLSDLTDHLHGLPHSLWFS